MLTKTIKIQTKVVTKLDANQFLAAIILRVVNII